MILHATKGCKVAEEEHPVSLILNCYPANLAKGNSSNAEKLKIPSQCTGLCWCQWRCNQKFLKASSRNREYILAHSNFYIS